jgi:signal transduction histidine kinase
VRLPKLFRTSSFRLTLLYAAVFEVSVLVLFGIIYWGTAGYMAEQIDTAVDAELSSLLEDYRSHGLAYVAQVIEQRSHAPDHGSHYYLLQDATGDTVVGNLMSVRPIAGWHNLPAPRHGKKENDDEARIRAKAVKLPGDIFLLVGQDMDRLLELRELVVHSFAWAFGVTLGLALVAGSFLSVVVLRRVDTINRATQEIMDGNLSRRIATRGTDDEFDQLSENLNRMLDRVQVLMEGLHQVSNDIAHDLRTPLSRLRQRLEAVRARAKTIPDYEEAVDQALADTDTILHTFVAMLRIAQIESGGRRAGFTNVDLSDVFTTILEVYAPVAEDRGQQLGGHVMSSVAVTGDRELLTQMLANLVENALRHTPSGARIEVLLEDRPTGPIGIIADNGPGIPPEARRKVFQRFVRLETSRTEAGSGLGLSLVAAIAELHGIAIELTDNRPGLRVTLTFPPRKQS